MLPNRYLTSKLFEKVGFMKKMNNNKLFIFFPLKQVKVYESSEV